MVRETSELKDGSHVAVNIPLEAEGERGGTLKRSFDLVLAGVGFLFSLPLWLIIILGIWLEDGRPLFIVQDRSGKRGRLFKSIKFRSMIKDAAKFNGVEDIEDDPRITRMGRILRNTALDELPQIINILKGDMSFVGPRALYPIIEDRESARYRHIREIPGFAVRSQVAPGLTGLTQVYAPKDISRQKKFRYDILYVKKRSFALDLKLIAMSFWITFRGKWESREKKF